MEPRAPVALLEMMYSARSFGQFLYTRFCIGEALRFLHEMEGSISSQPEDGKGQTHPNSILSHRYQLCRSPINMTFSANAWSLTLRTEKITFCPGSRT